MINLLLAILFLFFFGWIIHQWRFFKESGINRNYLWFVLALKFIISIFLTYIYTVKYPERSEADIFKYYDDSKIIFDAFFSAPLDFLKLMTGLGINNEYFYYEYYLDMNNWDRAFDSNVYNDSHTIIKFHVFFRFFSFGSFYVQNLWFIFLSIIGLTAFYKVIKSYIKSNRNLLLLGLFLFPSLVLWTSAGLKESVLIFALGLFILALHQLLERRFKLNVILIFLGLLFLLITLKFYVLVAIIPALCCYLTAYFWKRPLWLVYGSISTLLILIAFNVQHFTSVNLSKILDRKQSDFVRLAEWQHAGSYFEITDIEPNAIGILKVVPEGILNCFIRPLPSSDLELLTTFGLVENVLLLILFILLCYSFLKRPELTRTQKNFFAFSLLFTVFLFAIIGTTTPVAGALLRYKVPALIFFYTAVIGYARDNQWVYRLELDFKKLKLANG